MSAPVNNEFWKARSSHGRKPIFSEPESLWVACCEYFQWVEDNPLLSTELVKFQGAATEAVLPKMRAMTLQGLCRFIDIQYVTWIDWRRNRKDLSNVITRVEEVVYEQKLTGAAADLLNPNIIARDLGLADKKEHSGGIVIERVNFTDNANTNTE